MPEGETPVSNHISIDALSEAVMEQLDEYRELATDEMKKAVKDAGKTVKDEINGSAPVKTGRYAKSWKSKTTAESYSDIEVTVYSPKRYMLAHLLEHGHAKRGGGRVRAISHIKPAEEIGEEQLERDITRALKG